MSSEDGPSLVPRLHGRTLEKTEKIIKVFIVLLFFKYFVIFLCLLKLLSYQEKAFTIILSWL